MDGFINEICMTLAIYGAKHLMPLMIITFLLAILLKLLIFYLIKREYYFSSAFETRTHRFLDGKYEPLSEKKNNFHNLVEYILKKTFHEVYMMRKKNYRKRRGDATVALLNEIFLIERGVQNLVDDTLKQTRYHQAKEVPNFSGISKFVFMSNPYFNKLWGFIPVKVANNAISILPSLLIIGGIFGTFLGITQGLPMLKTMDMGNLAAAQKTLGGFLGSMTFAMYSSVIGIFLSASLTIINTFLSINTIYLSLIDKYTQSLELLWKESNFQITNVVQSNKIQSLDSGKQDKRR